MDRRKAIKNIGFTFGAITMSSTMVSLIQSCQSDNSTWRPKIFNKDQARVVENMLEIIIPETETPGAKSLKLIQVVDADIFYNYSKQRQNNLICLIDEFIIMLKDKEQVRSVGDISEKNLEQYLDKYLNILDPINNDKELYMGWKDLSEGSEWCDIIRKLAPNDKEYLYSNICGVFQDMAANSYKASEYVLTNIRGYIPVPGRYDGCVDV